MAKYERTERNGIRYLFRSEKTGDYPSRLDALYEICDAELNSEKKVHKEWEFLVKKHRTFLKKFCRFVKPMVTVANRRSGLNVLDEDVDLVCAQIYKDWYDRQTG